MDSRLLLALEYLGLMEKKMETTGIIGIMGLYRGYIGFIGYMLGLFGDSGKESGNCHGSESRTWVEGLGFRLEV